MEGLSETKAPSQGGNARRPIEAKEMDAYRIQTEPDYRATRDEIVLFEAAYRDRLPVMLKRPDGLRQDPLKESTKQRFVAIEFHYPEASVRLKS
jgi:hypothetical protein